MPGRVKSIDTGAAKAIARRRADRHGKEMAEYLRPLGRGFDPISRGLKSPSTPSPSIRWPGRVEAGAAVVAHSRAEG